MTFPFLSKSPSAPVFPEPLNSDHPLMMAAKAKRIERAQKIRDAAMQAFRRDYFLQCPDHDVTVDVIDKRATEMAERLYPAVTDENADDYFNRSF